MTASHAPLRRNVSRKRKSRLRKGEKVTVLEFLDDDEYLGGDFFVCIDWMGRKMGVSLAQPKLPKVNKETRQTVEDWQPWKGRGYQF